MSKEKDPVLEEIQKQEKQAIKAQEKTDKARKTEVKAQEKLDKTSEKLSKATTEKQNATEALRKQSSYTLALQNAINKSNGVTKDLSTTQKVLQSKLTAEQKEKEKLTEKKTKAIEKESQAKVKKETAEVKLRDAQEAKKVAEAEQKYYESVLNDSRIDSSNRHGIDSRALFDIKSTTEKPQSIKDKELAEATKKSWTERLKEAQIKYDAKEKMYQEKTWEFLKENVGKPVKDYAVDPVVDVGKTSWNIFKSYGGVFGIDSTDVNGNKIEKKNVISEWWDNRKNREAEAEKILGSISGEMEAEGAPLSEKEKQKLLKSIKTDLYHKEINYEYGKYFSHQKLLSDLDTSATNKLKYGEWGLPLVNGIDPKAMAGELKDFFSDMKNLLKDEIPGILEDTRDEMKNQFLSWITPTFKNSFMNSGNKLKDFSSFLGRDVNVNILEGTIVERMKNGVPFKGSDNLHFPVWYKDFKTDDMLKAAPGLSKMPKYNRVYFSDPDLTKPYSIPKRFVSNGGLVGRALGTENLKAIERSGQDPNTWADFKEGKRFQRDVKSKELTKKPLAGPFKNYNWGSDTAENDLEKIQYPFSKIRTALNSKLEGGLNDSLAFFRMLSSDPLIKGTQFNLFIEDDESIDSIEDEEKGTSYGNFKNYKLQSFRVQNFNVPDLKRNTQNSFYGMGALSYVTDNAPIQEYKTEITVTCDRSLDVFEKLLKKTNSCIEEKTDEYNLTHIANVFERKSSKAVLQVLNGRYLELENNINLLQEGEKYSFEEIVDIYNKYKEEVGESWEKEDKSAVNYYQNVNKDVTGTLEYQALPQFVFENFKIFSVDSDFTFDAKSTKVLELKVSVGWTRMKMRYISKEDEEQILKGILAEAVGTEIPTTGETPV